MKNSLKISRRNLLLSGAGMGVLGLFPSLKARGNTSINRLVVVRAFGGWDVTYCMDPRLTTSLVDGPDLDINGNAESIEKYGSSTGNGGIDIMINNAKRPSVDTFFSSNAANTIVVNGIYTGSIVHQDCEYRILTGTRGKTSPDIGTIACVTHGDPYALPYLDLTGGAMVGEYAAMTGQLGRNNQIIGLLNRGIPIPGPQGSGISYPIYNPGDTQQAAINSYLEYRRSQFGQSGHNALNSLARLDSLDEAVSRKLDLIDSSSLLLDNLSFGSSSSLADQAELAAIAMEAGLSHSVALQVGGWDTHDNISEQHDLYEELFIGLNALVAQLQSRGLYQDTMIVVLSEMTRTPRRNADGGKDHWSSTSAMLIGGAVDGGKVIGATNSALEPVGIDLNTGEPDSSASPLSYDQFTAGILHSIGADTEEWLPNVEVLHGIID